VRAQHWWSGRSTGSTASTRSTRSIRYWGHGERGLAPVLFVHGYCGTERVWAPLRAALTAAGFNCLISLCYNAVTSDVREIADRLVDESRRALQATGAGKVHLIGHSLGGLVVREAVQRRGLAGSTGTAVTIATPHGGTWVARFGLGPSARQMRPGSDFLNELGRAALSAGPRWVMLHGGSDRVVPANSAIPESDDSRVITLRPADAGHRSITRHADVVRSIVTELLHADRRAAVR